eukprot:150610_1
MSTSPDCNWEIEHTKLLNIKLSTSMSICYFSIYLLLTLIISVYASCKSSLFNTIATTDDKQNTSNKKLSTYDKCKPYLKCYIFVILHFSIQSINIGNNTIIFYFNHKLHQ